MRRTLPKKVLQYIQPVDPQHEVILARFWAAYRSYAGERESDEQIAHTERELLGGVFQIPESKWHQFRPRMKSDFNPAESRRALQWLAERYKQEQLQKQRSARKSQKRKAPKKPIVILKKHSPSNGQ